MRFVYKLLLINVLASCGAPGSDTVFKKGDDSARDSTSKQVVETRKQPAIRTYSGFFRRVGDEFQIQPCGARSPLAIYGPPMPQYLLKERVRFHGVWEGVKAFAVLQGAVVTDTVDAAAALRGNVKAGPRTRFMLAGVDSLRTWRGSDCSGMRVN